MTSMRIFGVGCVTGGVVTALVWTLSAAAPKSASSKASPEAADAAARLQRVEDRLTSLALEIHFSRGSASGSSTSTTRGNDLLVALDNLEREVYDPHHWPKSPQQADELQRRLKRFIRMLPTRAEEELLPRLVPVRWAVIVLGQLVLTRGDETIEQLNIAIEQCQAIAADAPDDDVAEERLNAVREALDKRIGELREAKLNCVIAAAEMFVESGQGDAMLVAAELNAAADQPRTQELLRKVVVRSHAQDASARVAAARQQLQSYTRQSDARVRQAGLMQVYEAALAMRIAATGAGEDSEVAKQVSGLLDDADTALRETAELQRKAEAERLRAYQRWALEQVAKAERLSYDTAIGQFDKTFRQFKYPTGEYTLEVCSELPAVLQLLAEKSGVPLSKQPLSVEQQRAIHKAIDGYTGWKGVDTELAYRVVREATVKYLLSIDARLLDPPVAQIYQRAFDGAWKKLDDRRDEQLYVAQQAAVIEKHQP
jgi:hypothetical protein